MTLKEKFDKVMVYPFSEYREQVKILKEENSNEYLKIADEFAIGFAEWFTNEKSEYSIMYGNQEKRFATFTEEYTAKELLEIYKKEKGL